MNAIVELPTDHRRHAKHLYWQGYRVCEIAELIGEKEKTLHSWKARDEWTGPARWSAFRPPPRRVWCS